ncbi:MAG: S1C family serine protease [Candidatus Limnocylindrales bacterium]
MTSGYALTDDDGIRLYSDFLSLGGVSQLGYPVSQRFVLGGLVTQATQKDILQWQPSTGRVTIANVFDLFTQLGLDPTLATTRMIPPTGDNSLDNQLTWPQIVARHLAILNQDPAIKARYFADPDPVDHFGLPQSAENYGSVFVIRCQRAAFQQWNVATSFAKPGDVTQVNAGDIAKELGVIPTTAATPTPAANEIVAPLGSTLTADRSTQSTVAAVAAQARPSLVRIDVSLPDGSGIASGILMDHNGDILTNEHVVDQAQSLRVTFANGTQLDGRVVGADAQNDLAVIRVAASAIGSGVTPATFGSGRSLESGQFVVALGFSPFFPTLPATRIGVFQRLTRTDPAVILSDTYILPGDSGGMLLSLSGQVVGINDEIRFTHQPAQPLVGFSIEARGAESIAQSLVQGR